MHVPMAEFTQVRAGFHHRHGNGIPVANEDDVAALDGPVLNDAFLLGGLQGVVEKIGVKLLRHCALASLALPC